MGRSGNSTPTSLQPIAHLLIARASLIMGRQYVHSLLLMGNNEGPFGPALLRGTFAALQTRRKLQVLPAWDRWVGDGQVWTAIFKTASVPASPHNLRFLPPSFPHRAVKMLDSTV